jgi:hypothetical protein
MSRNGQRRSSRPHIELSGGGAAWREGAGSAGAGAMVSEEEAAAIAAAIEQFMRDTAPAPATAERTQSPWLRAGLLEGTGHSPAARMPW